MDLRPKIAAEIVDALMADLGREGTVPNRERWVELALSKITSHNIPFPGDWDISCGHPEVVEAFLTKYPSVRPLLEACEAKARELWPDAVLVREVMRDPEGCSVCHEGQHLTLDILRNQEFIPEDPKTEAFMDWWAGHYPERASVDLFTPHLGF